MLVFVSQSLTIFIYNANGMVVEVSSQLLPNATEITLQDNSCVATFNAEAQIWSIQTMLDGCDTSLTANDDGTLIFSNKLQVNAFSESDSITIQDLIFIDFKCAYDSVY